MATNEEYWSQRANSWNETSYPNEESGNWVRLRIAQDFVAELDRGRLIDLGCGAGFALAMFLADGWDAGGADFASGMVEQARAHLRQCGHDPNRVFKAKLNDLSEFDNNSFDVVTCLGVLQYIEDDSPVHSQINRILKPGGVLISSYHNLLFDIFTFNRYTRKFFKDHYLSLLPPQNSEQLEQLDWALSGLLTHPEEPITHDANSARDHVSVNSVNPLTIGEKFVSMGFEPPSEIRYFNFHIAPPLIEKQFPQLREIADSLQYDLSADWRAMFAASQFIVMSRKVAAD